MAIREAGDCAGFMRARMREGEGAREREREGERERERLALPPQGQMLPGESSCTPCEPGTVSPTEGVS